MGAEPGDPARIRRRLVHTEDPPVSGLASGTPPQLSLVALLS